MIFAAIGLLVVALILLVTGVAKSSVAILVVSLFATVGAAALVLAANSYYRRARGLDGGTATGAGARGAGQATGAFAPPNGWQPAMVPGMPPIDGYPDLTADQAVAFVATLNLDELHAMRRYEVEHARRDAVLAAVDARVDEIVALRRQVLSR